MASEASRKKAEGFVDGIAGDVSDIYGSDGRGHWVESLAAALDEARAEGAEDRTVQIIAALEDLSLRPQDGGPVYYATYEFGGEVKTVALQPQQIEPVFRAMRDAIGGYEKLQEWRKRIEGEAEKRGAERERWINHKQAATQADEHHRADNHNEAKAVGVVRDLITARGAMRGPEE